MTRGEGHKTQVLEVAQDRLPFAGRCPPIKEQVRPGTVEGVFCIAQQGDETVVGDKAKITAVCTLHMHTHMHACTHTHTCTHARTHARTRTHAHTHTHTHTHTIPC